MARDLRTGQLSRLLEYLPAIFRDPPDPLAQPQPPLPVGRFLMAFESILLGLPKSSDDECRELLLQPPGFEEILGGALRLRQDSPPETLLEGIHRYFDPGPDYPADEKKMENYNRAPSEFLPWLAGWVALTLRDDWEDKHKRKFIADAVQLYRLRGTKDGVMQFVQAYTDLPVEISEQSEEFQLGVHSTIGEDTRIEGGAPFFFRVRVKLPTLVDLQKEIDIVTAIIELQKPAHTSFKLDVDTAVFLQIGDHSQIGVDTLLGAPSA